MILLLLSIQAAECNIWCISENYDKGSYNLTTKQCECLNCYDYDIIKLRKVKKSLILKEPQEVYEPYEESPYLKIK